MFLHCVAAQGEFMNNSIKLCLFRSLFIASAFIAVGAGLSQSAHAMAKVRPRIVGANLRPVQCAIVNDGTSVLASGHEALRMFAFNRIRTFRNGTSSTVDTFPGTPYYVMPSVVISGGASLFVGQMTIQSATELGWDQPDIREVSVCCGLEPASILSGTAYHRDFFYKDGYAACENVATLRTANP
jgi:hypothetical protein